MESRVCVSAIDSDEPIQIQVRWALHLARLRAMDVVFVLMIESNQPRFNNIDLEEPGKPDEEDAIAALKNAINAYSEDAAEVAAPIKSELNADEIGRLSEPVDSTSENQQNVDIETAANMDISAKALYYNDPAWARNEIATEIDNVEAALFTMVRSQMLGKKKRDFVVERGRFLEFLPCEIVLCQGLTEEQGFSRVAVLQRPGGNQQAALRLAADLASASQQLTALQVNPDIGVDSQLVGERRLERFLAKLPTIKRLSIDRRVAVNDNVQNAVQDLWNESSFDILVVPGKALRPEQGIGFRFGRNIPVAVTMTASPFTSKTRQFVKETLRQNVPQISRQDRVGLVERVQSNAEWNFDFVVLMVLSASIAAFGLMQNSAAVVIGAMLVAPLMTPILGLGLALVQANLLLTKISARALSRGIAVALVSGLVIGLLSRGFNEPTREVFARTQPGLFDLAVAFLSGLAAAYAQSRPNLIAALPGVAIAAALVPPIVAAGLLLSLWELELALGAFSLFVINMVAIVFASMLAMFAVGIRQSKQEKWPARLGVAFIAAFFALFLWSSVNKYDVQITRDVPTGLDEAIESVLAPHYRLVDVAIAYDELGYQLNLDVEGKKPIDPSTAKAVRLKAAEFYGEASRIRLVARISAEDF